MTLYVPRLVVSLIWPHLMDSWTLLYMAKILDVPHSGSQANTTYSHNRAGQYKRNRRVPTNNPTARRTAIRTAFGSASTGWSSLSSADQNAWIAYADGHPYVDRLGQSIKLTGHQMYVAINAMLLQIGQDAVSSPPASSDVFSATGNTGVFSVATGLALTLTGVGNSADFLLVSLSRPVSAGRTFVATFQQTKVEAGTATTSTMTTAAYGALLGTPVAGQKVFAKLTPVNQYGVRGVPLIIPIVVTA